MAIPQVRLALASNGCCRARETLAPQLIQLIQLTNLINSQLEGAIVNHIHWMVELAIKPGQTESLQTLVAEMVASVEATESGALDYEYHVTRDGPSLSSV